MEFLRSVKGSVSIFLCLILLPMVTYSTMIIDASRLQTSRTVIASAGDLAMNAALSEYEQVLEDMYGLFATAGSEEEIEEQLKSYFKQTIEGKLYKGDRDDYKTVSGLTDELISRIFEEDPEENLSNLIKMEVKDFEYKQVENSELSNPAIMKRQIIEYMKYKGPVSIAGGLLTKLDFLKDTEKQTEVVEKKIEYTETLSEIEDVCIRAFEAIEGVRDDYNNKKNGYNYSAADSYNNYVTNNGKEEVTDRVRNMLEGTKKKLEDMSAYILMDCRSAANSTVVSEITDVTQPVFEGKPDYNNSDIKSSDIKNYMDSISNELNKKQGSESNYFVFSDDGATLNSNYQEIMDKIKEINSSISELNLTSSDIDSIKNFFNYQNDACNIINNNKEFLKNMVYFCDYINYVKSEYDYAFKQYETVWEKEKIEAYKNGGITDEEDIKNKLEEDKKDENGDYFKCEELKQNIDKLCDNVNSNNYKSGIDSLINSATNKDYYSKGMRDKLSGAKSDIWSWHSKAKEVYDKANNAINALNSVKQKMTSSENKKNQWQSSIDSVSEGATKTSMQSDLDTSTNGLSMEDIDALIGVMNGIKEEFKIVYEGLESLMFNIYPLYSISIDPYGIFNQHIYQVVANYANESGEISDLAKKITEEEFDVNFYEDENVLFTTTARIINGEGEGENFYNTLKNIYKPKKSTASEEQKKSVENINKLTSTDENGTPKVDVTTSETPEKSEEPEKSEGNKEDGERDKEKKENISLGEIYESTYGEKAIENSNDNKKISSMELSKDKDSYKDNADSAKDSLKASKSILSSLSDIITGIRDYAYLEEYFTEMFTCRTYALENKNEKLLNGYDVSGEKTINTGNDWYRKEVEYILWGNADSEKNYAYTDAWIYAIRFALNAIYAFTATDIQTFALETATAIAGWTVIGVPIIQVGITIALALAESAYDMFLLHEGYDVPIYKNSSNFICSPTGITSNVSKEFTKKLIDEASKKAEKSLDSALDKFSEKAYTTIGEATNDVETFVNDYVEQQSNSIKSSIQNQFVNPIINSILPILNQINDTAGNVKDKVDDKVDDAIDAAWNKIIENVNSMPDGILKELTNEALENSENYKKKIKDDIKNYYDEIISDSVEPTKKLTEILTGTNGHITSLINSISNSIEEKVSEIGKDINDKVKELGDEGVNNIKSVLHDEIGSASEKISGKVTKLMDEGSKKVDLTKTPAKDSSASGGFTFNYKEYCKLLVFVRLSTGNQDIMLKRAAVIIEANIRTAKKNANDKFRIANSHTLVSINANVDMGTLFPWMVSLSDTSGTNGSAEMEFDLNHVGEYRVPINYQAVNGY